MAATAKVCGLSTVEAVDAAVAGGASHIGFVFFPASPRDVSVEQAARLAGRLPERVRAVGVFVDPDDELVAGAVRGARLCAVQLHRASPERAAHLRRLAGVETWAAVPVRTRADLEGGRAYIGAADRLLYDAAPPRGAAVPGGRGVRFDWAVLDGYRHPLPWVLSGGLDAGNAGEAIRRTGARMVDASSGLETAPGVKDACRIAAFLAAVAAA